MYHAPAVHKLQPQTTNYKLQTTNQAKPNHKLQTTNYKPTTNYKLQLQTTNYKLQTANQTTNYKLQTTNYKPNYKLQTTNYKLQTIDRPKHNKRRTRNELKLSYSAQT
jgi:hypothetical protein